MGQYIKKPIIVEAVQFLGNPHAVDVTDAFSEYPEWLSFKLHKDIVLPEDKGNIVQIKTPHGWTTTEPGNYIMLNVQGSEVYPISAETLELSYNKVEKEEEN